MIDMQIRLEEWKNKLLDLSKRNPLLHYGGTRHPSLTMESPDIFALWDRFVVKEEHLVFPYMEEGEDEDSLDDEQIKASVVNGNVLTNQPVKEQQKVLRRMRDKAKRSMEEQGLNMLYLSFGFVHWRESQSSDQYFDAPLILVPATLTWESITAPFRLSPCADEIVVNPTLLYKLEHEFGIKLPELNLEGALSDYFDQVSNMIVKNHWLLLRSAGLSVLSFFKMNMYSDLERRKGIILNNPVICALGGDGSKLPPRFDLADINHYDHDRNETPASVFQVVDADSSQQDAILCAKRGMSFILQGPPGTGKSQTITNIIAECLANGKKVLFVSEKMAALEVVHKRLTEAGLSDFCLTLHSYKANKRETLDQLEKTLELSNQKDKLREDALQKLNLLSSYRENLNEYATEIHIPVQPLNQSIYQVNGHLAKLQDKQEIIFSLCNVETVSRSDFDQWNDALSTFAQTVGKTSDDYQSNPWHGANIGIITNELRHDIGARLDKLLPKIADMIALADEIALRLDMELIPSRIGLEQLERVLCIAARSPKVPVSWIAEDGMNALLAEVDRCATMQGQYEECRQDIHAVQTAIASLDCTEILNDLLPLDTSAKIQAEIARIKAKVLEVPYYTVWSGLPNMKVPMELLEIVEEKDTERNQCMADISAEYDAGIFSIDYDGMYRRFKSDYTSAFAIFNRHYRTDKRIIQSYHKEYIKNISDESAIGVLKQLCRMDEIKKQMEEEDTASSLQAFFGALLDKKSMDFSALHQAINAYKKINEYLDALYQIDHTIGNMESQESLLKLHYEHLYQGVVTDWQSIRNALTWASAFKASVAEFSGKPKDYLCAVCTQEDVIAASGIYSQRMQAALNDIDKELQWFCTLFDSEEKLCNMPMTALSNRILACKNDLTSLEKWIDFQEARKNCCQIGLSDYIAKVEEICIASDDIVPIFKKRFYRLWLDNILPSHPAVANFRRYKQEATISEFSKLDKLQFEIAKARIWGKLVNDLPDVQHFTSGADEIGTLRREATKQRCIMSTRRLLGKIPNLILRLKPCLMMSPLSVSLYLEDDHYMFDTVIFDEASQVCTEDAIGAISRGKQVIIAGDNKQLPPAKYYEMARSNDEFDEEDDDLNDNPNAYDSILDEAALLPACTLQWHYRSRHEHLIAYSNAKIYKNKLITFPSNMDRAPDNGVEYIFTKDGYYDQGGKRGNVVEAKRVADLVFEHFSKYPNRSLGVIAFGVIQQQAIDTAMRKKRREDQSFEPFFNEERPEAFFIKNLENVQGDERDTIIFSIGYAKDQAGKMRMSFGPLSKEGGERRLNVAITRAKYNVKLVGSIMPTDINTDKISKEGPKLLRGYIDFAMLGPSVLQNEITKGDIAQYDSPFEEAVDGLLDRKGYKVALQVGCSGYRIDMAVEHPTLSGRYVVGIECDGATYHSARTARERDRLRQSILESMGWKIYRIWSTDWIKDPVKEGERLIHAVDKAIAEYREEVPLSVPVESSRKPDEFLTVEKQKPSLGQQANPYGFIEVNPSDFHKLPHAMNCEPKIADCIMLVVENEYPIHYELLCQRLAKQLGRERITLVVRQRVEDELCSMHAKIIRKEDFLYPAGYTEVYPRTLNNRPIKYISQDELAAAMLKVACNCIGATRESLITETVRAYGFARSGSIIIAAMDATYDQLLQNKEFYEVGGKVTIGQPSLSSSERRQ